MSAASYTYTGDASTDTPATGFEFPCVFARTVARYLLLVLPAAHRELGQWRRRAAAIPSANLRRTASLALAKRGNIEGAALFATLAPAANRRGAIRAMVAFQTAYNYLDALSELPSGDPVANGYQLHQALLIALQPGAAHEDYYAHNPDSDDGGFLIAILDACRDALAGLPSYPMLAWSGLEAAERIVDFQALNLGEAQGGHDALESWARRAAPVSGDLEWWETAAGAGSSLAIYALIAAAAADRHSDACDGHEIDRAYSRPIGALHTLLDSLVDRREDRDGGRVCLLDYYGSPSETANRLAELAIRAVDVTTCLPSPHAHRVIVTAMCSFYLSAPECNTAEAQSVRHALTRMMGFSLNAAIALFRARRLVAHFTGGGYC